MALRLQKAAEARRNRMAASLVSVASHTITRIGFGVSGTSVTCLPAPATDATTRLADGTDTNSRMTAVAELHSSSTGEDHPLKPISLNFTSRQTTDGKEEHGMTGNNVEEREDCDSRTPTASRRPPDVAKQPVEVTPLLERSVDSGRRGLNNSSDVFIASTSGVDGSRFPAKRTTSQYRRRWLIVLPDDDDEVEESSTSSAGNDGRRPEKTAVRHSVDAGRLRACGGTRSQRRSLFELPTNVATTLAAPSMSSLSSDESRDSDSAVSDEMENVVNDVIDVATTTGERVDSTPQHPLNQSVGFDHLSAEKNQLTIKDDYVAMTTMMSFVGKCDELPADRCGATQVAKHEQEHRKNNDDKNTDKKDDVAGAEKSIKRAADRWRRTAKSHFTAGRRFAHLRHWKMQRRSAAQPPTSSSSIDHHQTPVSRLPLLSWQLSVTDVLQRFSRVDYCTLFIFIAPLPCFINSLITP